MTQTCELRVKKIELAKGGKQDYGIVELEGSTADMKLRVPLAVAREFCVGEMVEVAISRKAMR